MLRLLPGILCCVILCFCACKKDDNTPEPGKLTPVAELATSKGKGIATPVTGKWRWLKSFHSSTGDSNPTISGYTERIEFGSDSTMTIYRDNLYYYQLTYLYIKDYKFKNTMFDVTLVNNYTYKTTFKGDTLTLSTFDFVDENSMTYVKLP